MSQLERYIEEICEMPFILSHPLVIITGKPIVCILMRTDMILYIS